MSNDPEPDYFSDSISEELLNRLAQMTGIDTDVPRDGDRA